MFSESGGANFLRRLVPVIWEEANRDPKIVDWMLSFALVYLRQRDGIERVELLLRGIADEISTLTEEETTDAV